MATRNMLQEDPRRQGGKGEPVGNRYRLDFAEVETNGTVPVLVLHFSGQVSPGLSEVPPALNKENFLIRGGRRIADIKVTKAYYSQPTDPPMVPEHEKCLFLKLDKFGDSSPYTVFVIQPGAARDELTADSCPPWLDRRHSSAEFRFFVEETSDLDCKVGPGCEPERPAAEPHIDYLAKDYGSFRKLILDRLRLIMPEWKNRHVPEIEMALVEILAYVGDHLSYYQDAVATEAYLDTANHRISVRRHARLVDYRMHEGCNARAWLAISIGDTTEVDPTDLGFYAVVKEDPDSRVRQDTPVPDDSHVFFQAVPLPSDPKVRGGRLFAGDRNHDGFKVTFRPEHNAISFYTWRNRDYCLPRGATEAALIDEEMDSGDAGQNPNQRRQQQKPTQQAPIPTEKVGKLLLKEGDVLIFEEMANPDPDDLGRANPCHRHAVRLTKVVADTDWSADPPQPILRITWHHDDALPFPLVVSVEEDPCKEKGREISVALGNVMLVEQGFSLDPEYIGQVPRKTVVETVRPDGMPDRIVVPGAFRPVLEQGPISFGEPVPASASAARLIDQDPRDAIPEIYLEQYESDETSQTAEVTEVVDGTQQDSFHPALQGLQSQYPVPISSGSVISSQSTKQIADQVIDTHGWPADEPEEWEPRYDLLSSERNDRHFVVETDDDGRARLRFGDGEMGKRPAAGSLFKAKYRIGNGPRGNVGAESIRYILPVGSIPNLIRIRNPLPAAGGKDPESLEEVKRRAPRAFRKELRRAIIADDYARIAERDPRVQRAHARIRWTGSWYQVDVAVDPIGGGPANDLCRSIERDLQAFRRIGHHVRVLPAECVPLDIGLAVEVKPNYLKGHVKARLWEVFSNRVLPDGTLGLFHPDNWTFGQSVYMSRLLAAAQAVPGVECVAVDKFQRLYLPAAGEIESGVLPIADRQIARLDNDPAYPENGRLILTVRGGR